MSAFLSSVIPLRFLVHPVACLRSSRLVFGTSAGRTFLNASLFKEMQVKRGTKSLVEFTLLNDGKLQKFVAKSKTNDIADNLKATLDKFKPTA